MKRAHSKCGFTMIELIVVIVIIGVLALALVPVVGKFRTSGDEAVSRNNLMRLGRAAIIYRSETENCYPAAGGYSASFTWINPTNYNDQQTRYGRARGWVYFEHSCPRSKGDESASEKLGDGYAADDYGLGRKDTDATGTYVNEDGCCTCWDSKSNNGGMSPKPANWQAKATDAYSQAQVAIINGALFELLGKDLRAYSNPAFEKRAVQKLGVARANICRAYAMNLVTGTDKDIYDTNRGGYAGGGGSYGIRYGKEDLTPYIDSSSQTSALPAQTVLFVELDLDNNALKKSNALEGDQVWDWDDGDESMGFNHENNGAMYAHVCFADGHVEAVRDPSRDPTSPDQDRRKRLSKWYGSGGVNASGEKWD